MLSLSKIFALGLITSGLFCSQAFANEAELQLLRQQIDQMQKQLNLMQQKLEQQEHTLHTPKRKTDHTEPTPIQATIATPVPAAPSGYHVTFSPSPNIESADGKFSFQPFGRAHVDYTFFDDDLKNHPDNADFRRARLGVKGRFSRDFDYRFELDFAADDSKIRSSFIQYSGFEHFKFKLGHMKPFLGMEQALSANHLSFLERSAPNNAFTRGHQIGAGILMGGDHWALNIGGSSGSTGDVSTADDEALSYDIRGTISPIAENGRVLHTGLAASYRDDDTIHLRARSSGIGDPLVSTGEIVGVDHTLILGAEIAGVYDGFWTQGEYFHAAIDRQSQMDLDFDGYVVQAGYLLTGETRPYSGKNGNFGRIRPLKPFSLSNNTYGAWEILGRYEHLNLNDKIAGVFGGKLDSYTIGLNWYLHDHIRAMFNFIDVETDSRAVTPDDSPKIFSTRLSWDF